jgi:hypothetical protein
MKGKRCSSNSSSSDDSSFGSQSSDGSSSTDTSSLTCNDKCSTNYKDCHSSVSSSFKRPCNSSGSPKDCPKDCQVDCDVKHRFIVKLGKCRVKKTVQYNHIIVTDVTHHIKETVNCIHKRHRDVDNGEVCKTIPGEQCKNLPSNFKEECEKDKDVIAKSVKIFRQSDLSCKPCKPDPKCRPYYPYNRRRNGDIIE